MAADASASYEDESLYSRQMMMLGKEAMRKMAQASVFVSGMSGLGAEIAKNVALAGVKSLTLHDTKAASHWDLGTNFYLSEEHVEGSINRAEATFPSVAELNPYTRLSLSTVDLTDAKEYEAALKDFSCIVLTDAPMSVQLAINEFCRARGIKFIAADVFGVFAFGFCDFGESFEVVDPTGEEPKSALVGDLVIADGRATVTCLDEHRHDLETGNGISLSELTGELASLNGETFIIRDESPSKFSFEVPAGTKGAFEKGKGSIDEVKVPQKVVHHSLSAQLANPDLTIADLGKFEDPPHVFAGLQALHAFQQEKGDLPRVWNKEDSDAVVALAAEKFSGEGEIKEDVVRLMSFTCRGSYVGQTAFLGGVISQEVLKATSGKYGPLSQWLLFDTRELCPDVGAADGDVTQYAPRNDRLDSNRACYGQDLCDEISKVKLFMIGCGAIGCELLKNFAMLGVATAGDGCITVTDNDHIEKSNLNRQFLFRNDDIGHPKSERAAAAAQRMNAALKISHHLDKVGPDTQAKYSDAFFSEQNIICNALDNLQARIYVDGRCVQTKKPLLESGTLGPKGHVQVILPFKTESYGSQRDPPEKDVPFCTLKSFPSQIEHCIEWARDFSFGGQFVSKPQQFQQIMEQDWDTLIRKLKEPYGGGLDLRVVRTAHKMITTKPSTWEDCLVFARNRFQAYFVNKTKTLLNAFPLDHVADPETGTLFWVSPKRPPTEIPFDFDDETHRLFVLSCAALQAAVFRIPVPDGLRAPSDALLASCRKTVEGAPVAEWQPKSKVIVTDEKASKEEASKEQEKGGPSDDELDALCKELAGILEKGGSKEAFGTVDFADFEKDDDTNFHIDFLSACANLRARVYAIKEVDRLKVKGIAGRIMPAIATTTAAVSGCVTSELVKIVKGCEMEQHRNLFMNLALPFWGFAEPVQAEKKMLTDKVGITIWDQWEVKKPEGGAMTLQAFCDAIKEQYHLDVGGVFKGAMMVYVPVFPGHKRRLGKQMKELLKHDGKSAYQDLIVTFSDGKEDVSGPPVRFYF